MELTPQDIKHRILHVLSIYPKISPTMLQVGIGPQTKPQDWRPVMNLLIDEEHIVVDTIQRASPSRKYHTYTILEMSDTGKEVLDKINQLLDEKESMPIG